MIVLFEKWILIQKTRTHFFTISSQHITDTDFDTIKKNYP